MIADGGFVACNCSGKSEAGVGAAWGIGSELESSIPVEDLECDGEWSSFIVEILAVHEGIRALVSEDEKTPLSAPVTIIVVDGNQSLIDNINDAKKSEVTVCLRFL